MADVKISGLPAGASLTGTEVVPVVQSGNTVKVSLQSIADLSGNGTVTSVGITVPTGLVVTGSPVTTSGTLAVTYDTGYAIPTTAKQTNWDLAYSWGNHATAGYLDSGDIGVTVQGYNANTVIDASYVHTDNNYTTTEKSKLAGIAAGAEVNVNADWNAVSGDAQILNKPTIPTKTSDLTNDSGFVTSSGVTSITAGTGLSGGTITSTGTLALANTAVTAGSYTHASITVDAQGRITAASSGTVTSGTVTSVDITVPTGLSVSGNPITSSGTLAISLATGYSIPTTAKQTDWDTAYTERNQWDGGSTGLVAATGRTSLGLGTMATANTSSYSTTGTDTTYAYRANNLSDLANASTARTNLGLGTAATMTGPSGTIVGTTDTQTLTNKRINARAVAASATSGSLTPNGDTTDVYNAFGLTGAITLNAPSGTPVDGQRLILRFEDNGTGRGITWTTTSGAFRAVGVTLPTTTTASKVIYVGCVYNSTDVFWDVIAVVTQA